MRARRIERGYSLSQLAGKAGLKAASFVHSVERGLKVPSEGVARGLARALGDDEELYVAWARLRGRGNVAGAMAASGLLRDALRSAVPDPEASGPAVLIQVPVLVEGSDPGPWPGSGARSVEVLRLDPRLLSNAADLIGPFAYRIARAVAGAGEGLRPGDLAIFSRGPAPPSAGICAWHNPDFVGGESASRAGAGAVVVGILPAPESGPRRPTIVGRLAAIIRVSKSEVAVGGARAV